MSLLLLICFIPIGFYLMLRSKQLAKRKTLAYRADFGKDMGPLGEVVSRWLFLLGGFVLVVVSSWQIVTFFFSSGK